MRQSVTCMCMFLVLLSASILGCGGSNSGPVEKGTTASGGLIIFHAGSLSVPFRQVRESFNRVYPQVNVVLEAAGSRTCARKISELKRSCDVMASADHTVIDTLLIPDYADWNIKFASNEMAIVFRKGSRSREKINRDNWHEILMRKDVSFGRADPDSDPCGYRTVLTIKLAERYHNKKGLAEKMLAKDLRYIRSKETDLLALLETGEIDYVFIYRSVAEQHGLETLLLPDEINLKSPELAGLYATVEVSVSGRKPGTKITKRGTPMVYGVTIPKNAPNPIAALAFVQFLLDEERGLAIMEENGQPSVVPSASGSYEKIPDTLKEFALPGRL